MVKRLFDIFSATIGLVVLLPLLLAVAVGIKMDSPGPVFFRQERMGRGGKPFRIFKFRTMQVMQSADASKLTVGNDARITNMGLILRPLRFDELPQLINVLLGDMSLVGPRPEVAKYVALYSPLNREMVLSVRPGITDIASIKFRDESSALAKEADPEKAYTQKILPKKLRLCRYYVRRQSFCFDLWIIVQTFKAVFGNA
jgi:lipopolysaccharide/colanic/teichoic acid biosynthesis glycosyltransferase